jgi:hypothetical protein
MVLFGKEFDADEGAEVGGGLRGVEGERGNTDGLLACAVDGITEKRLINKRPLRRKQARYFV